VEKRGGERRGPHDAGADCGRGDQVGRTRRPSQAGASGDENSRRAERLQVQGRIAQRIIPGNVRDDGRDDAEEPEKRNSDDRE
jgi:hypothetical protein